MAKATTNKETKATVNTLTKTGIKSISKQAVEHIANAINCDPTKAAITKAWKDKEADIVSAYTSFQAKAKDEADARRKAKAEELAEKAKKAQEIADQKAKDKKSNPQGETKTKKDTPKVLTITTARDGHCTRVKLGGRRVIELWIGKSYHDTWELNKDNQLKKQVKHKDEATARARFEEVLAEYTAKAEEVKDER